MGIRFLSFVATKRLRCRFRYGYRAANHGSRLLLQASGVDVLLRRLEALPQDGEVLA